MTVFLTTQYLEEADLLADRVGIIDHGHIVAEGTPASLKAEIGRSTVEALPAEAGDRQRIASIFERFGELQPGSPRGVAVRLATGDDGLANIVRALDAEDVRVVNLQLHAPSLDDVFLEKTGRSLEGAGGDAEPEPEPDRDFGTAASYPDRGADGGGNAYIDPRTHACIHACSHACIAADVCRGRRRHPGLDRAGVRHDGR